MIKTTDTEFDYVNYIVKYDREYGNGQSFKKDTFNPVDGQIVPILFAPSAPKISSKQKDDQLLGYALLEECCDGIVAKCNFVKDSYGNFVKRILITRDHYCLTFQTPPQFSLDKTINHGSITAVLVIPTWLVYQLKDSED